MGQRRNRTAGTSLPHNEPTPGPKGRDTRGYRNKRGRNRPDHGSQELAENHLAPGRSVALRVAPCLPLDFSADYGGCPE